jgi:hypothetical protein
MDHGRPESPHAVNHNPPPLKPIPTPRGGPAAIGRPIVIDVGGQITHARPFEIPGSALVNPVNPPAGTPTQGKPLK